MTTMSSRDFNRELDRRLRGAEARPGLPKAEERAIQLGCALAELRLSADVLPWPQQMPGLGHARDRATANGRVSMRTSRPEGPEGIVGHVPSGAPMPSRASGPRTDLIAPESEQTPPAVPQRVAGRARTALLLVAAAAVAGLLLLPLRQALAPRDAAPAPAPAIPAQPGPKDLDGAAPAATKELGSDAAASPISDVATTPSPASMLLERPTSTQPAPGGAESAVEPLWQSVGGPTPDGGQRSRAPGSDVGASRATPRVEEARTPITEPGLRAQDEPYPGPTGSASPAPRVTRIAPAPRPSPVPSATLAAPSPPPSPTRRVAPPTPTAAAATVEATSTMETAPSSTASTPATDTPGRRGP